MHAHKHVCTHTHTHTHTHTRMHRCTHAHMCTHMLQTRVTECLMPQQQQWQNIWQDLGTFLLFALNAICREWRECDTRQQTNPQISTIQRIVVLKVDIQVSNEPDKSSCFVGCKFQSSLTKCKSHCLVVTFAFSTHIAHPAGSWLDDYFAWLTPGENPPCCGFDNVTGAFCPATCKSDLIVCASCWQWLLDLFDSLCFSSFLENTKQDKTPLIVQNFQFLGNLCLWVGTNFVCFLLLLSCNFWLTWKMLVYVMVSRIDKQRETIALDRQGT